MGVPARERGVDRLAAAAASALKSVGDASASAAARVSKPVSWHMSASRPGSAAVTARDPRIAHRQPTPFATASVFSPRPNMTLPSLAESQAASELGGLSVVAPAPTLVAASTLSSSLRGGGSTMRSQLLGKELERERELRKASERELAELQRQLEERLGRCTAGASVTSARGRS
eukprot:TRINITY_DN47594_c0_g1_i1.p2 TRINITY_DN47594_c0_g1~~TRINITY_DN47594_c0_g1_i1.p2  ORF type:complete len:174 (+),score=40.03 TRINITY_DN47594_c0_g1_i1:77-598(+)